MSGQATENRNDETGLNKDAAGVEGEVRRESGGEKGMGKRAGMGQKGWEWGRRGGNGAMRRGEGRKGPRFHASGAEFH